MKTLTTLSIAIAMAFAFSGPVVFTASSAHAGDWDLGLCDWAYDCEDSYGQLIGEPEISLITPAHAADVECIFQDCYVWDGPDSDNLIADLE